jgi:hypothetical protein
LDITINISNANLINCFDSGIIEGWGVVKKGTTGRSLVTGKGTLKIEEWGDENEVVAVHSFRREHIIKGIRVLAVKYPHLLIDVLKNDPDMYTADPIIQCGVFGDLKYS